MPSIFVTAFEPYDRWTENSSWLTLVEFTKQVERDAQITTRLYPVDFEAVRHRLDMDLDADYDFALHLGQLPGAAGIHLESIAVNVGSDSHGAPGDFDPLVQDGPVAYRSELPLGPWAEMLRKAGIPTTLSYHAGTLLCNATMYLAHYHVEKKGFRTQTTFIHVPLDTGQAAREKKEMPTLPASVCAGALRMIVMELVKLEQSRDLKPA
ncbi:MAG: pyroglutamyl-peptidase I [Pirellulaceae bacterium]